MYYGGSRQKDDLGPHGSHLPTEIKIFNMEKVVFIQTTQLVKE
jgi:hypothetical protein